MNIITNNQIRHSKYYPYGMNEHERNLVELRYGGLITLEDAEFVFYKNQPYFMGDCMRLENNSDLKEWHGYFDDTFFSMVLVKYMPDDDGYIFGMAFS